MLLIEFDLQQHETHGGHVRQLAFAVAVHPFVVAITTRSRRPVRSRRSKVRDGGPPVCSPTRYYTAGEPA